MCLTKSRPSHDDGWTVGRRRPGGTEPGDADDAEHLVCGLLYDHRKHQVTSTAKHE
jgi:hypothetical protein